MVRTSERDRGTGLLAALPRLAVAASGVGCAGLGYDLSYHEAERTTMERQRRPFDASNLDAGTRRIFYRVRRARDLDRRDRGRRRAAGAMRLAPTATATGRRGRTPPPDGLPA